MQFAILSACVVSEGRNINIYKYLFKKSMPLKARESPGFDESEIQILVLLPGPGQLLTELCTNGPGAAEILSYLLSPHTGGLQ